jgi:predicted RNase H-like nuclease
VRLSVLDSLLSELADATVIAVDIPIGLSESGERSCDPAARQLLHPPRASSVFPAPIRQVLGETDYLSACAIHRSADGRGMSRQAFAILPKIREVDVALNRDSGLRPRVREIHPEVCFAVWNAGIAMRHKKSSSEGRAEREQLIEAKWPGERATLAATIQGRGYQADDLNDALAALWTAGRIDAGFAVVLGSRSVDRTGLPMEMWA